MRLKAALPAVTLAGESELITGAASGSRFALIRKQSYRPASLGCKAGWTTGMPAELANPRT